AGQQFIRIGSWFERDVHVKRFGDFIDHATANSEFKTWKVFNSGDGFLGVEDDAGAMGEISQHFDALVFGCEFWVFASDAIECHRQGLCTVTQKRKFGHLCQHKTAGSVAMHRK
ncbi:MAG: hypothetical protein RL659_2103, partial [Pseudomonadota bacterium]